MSKRQIKIIAISLILINAVFLGACKRASSNVTPTNIVASTPTPSQGAIITASTPLPSPSSTSIAPPTVEAYPFPTFQALPSQTRQAYPQPQTPANVGSPSAYPAPLQSATQNKTVQPTVQITPTPKTTTPEVTIPVTPQYPGPGTLPTITQKYPGPVITNTPIPYPGPATSTPRPTRTPLKSPTLGTPRQGTTTQPATPTGGIGTPLVTPTELPLRPPLSPPPAGSSVSIWHSWGIGETDVLKSIIQSFQRIYPDMTFSLLYVPLDDLYNTYQDAAYLGEGPSLLLGPAQWGPTLYDGELISDLNPFVPPDYLSRINLAALSSGEYKDALIGLPISQHGMLMYRNTAIIDTAPKTFEELDALSHQATHGGVVGSYLERGAYFSSADIIGLGGNLVNKDGYPQFNDSFGLEWLNLLQDYDKAGAVTFNTNRDLDMFKRGRVGIIIDGSWNISTLVGILGPDHLAIDPWPSYGTGNLSGWVEADSVFLNTNTTGDNRFAALAFMGYLIDPNVQLRLAEVGHIPSVTTTRPRDPLIQQAMQAFSQGVPYPITVDQRILSLYWSELDKAIQKVFVSGINPTAALKTASENLAILVKNLEISP